MEAVAKFIEFKDRIILIPISDLHLGSRACDERRIDELIKWILSKKDAYIIGLGDYVDMILRQDLKRFTGKVVKEDMLGMLDDLIRQQTNLAYKKLKPLVDDGRVLGLGVGNHEDTISRQHSFDVTRDLCERFKVPYLGYSFFYRLTLKKKSGGVKRNLVIYGHHGHGGGRKAGSSLLRLEDSLIAYDADVVLMGHNHRKVGTRLVRLGITPSGDPRIVHKPVIVARTGTFMKTCEQGFTHYSERAGYPPADLGVVRIDIRFKGHEKNLDVHISE